MRKTPAVIFLLVLLVSVCLSSEAPYSIVSKLTEIVKYGNILLTYNTIFSNSPGTFQDYFGFTETYNHHQAINNLSSIYSIPAESLKLPTYRTNSGLSSIRYICSSTLNSALKNLSIENLEKYNQDLFWLSKTNIKTFTYVLKQNFLDHYWPYRTEYFTTEKTLNYFYVYFTIFLGNVPWSFWTFWISLMFPVTEYISK